MEGSLFLPRVTMSWGIAVKMLERPWLIHHSQMVVCPSVCCLLFSCFDMVLCWYHIATFFPFNSLHQFHMPLSSFMRKTFSEKLASNHLTISMPPFWHVKCLLTIHLHSFLQFLLFCLSCFFFYTISQSHLYGIVHSLSLNVVIIHLSDVRKPWSWHSYDCELFIFLI